MRADKPDITETKKRLENLKKMWWEDTEEEWSKIKLDGPTVLTRNAVSGNEMDLETKALLKRYIEVDKIIKK